MIGWFLILGLFFVVKIAFLLTNNGWLGGFVKRFDLWQWTTFLSISGFFNFVNDNFYNTFAITSVKVVEIDF